MSCPPVLRTTSDITAPRAFVTVLALLSREAAELVVARGSFAVFAHAPSIARVPNDLDIYWFGQSDAVLPILEGLGAGPDVSVLQNRIISLPDDRIESLVRSDVLVGYPTASPQLIRCGLISAPIVVRGARWSSKSPPLRASHFGRA